MKELYQSSAIEVSRKGHPEKHRVRADMHLSVKEGNSHIWYVRCFLDDYELGSTRLVSTLTKAGPTTAATTWVKKCLAKYFGVSPSALDLQGSIKWTGK